MAFIINSIYEFIKGHFWNKLWSESQLEGKLRILRKNRIKNWIKTKNWIKIRRREENRVKIRKNEVKGANMCLWWR